MEQDVTQLKKRFSELSRRAEERGYTVYSDFLTLSEQSVLLSELPYTELLGGYPSAERKIACFGETWGAEPPTVWIKISPISQKFADLLTHRDFLGALIGLGIKREVLGDIVIYENCGYLYCLESISRFIISELKQVKRTSVTCEITNEPPENCASLPQKEKMPVASERLDALVASVFKLSRTESQALFDAELVFVNSRTVKRPSAEPSVGDIVSVRGYGRFIYEGIDGQTKKGRLWVAVRIYK